jgi:hypothetical protein
MPEGHMSEIGTDRRGNAIYPGDRVWVYGDERVGGYFARANCICDCTICQGKHTGVDLAITVTPEPVGVRASRAAMTGLVEVAPSVLIRRVVRGIGA